MRTYYSNESVNMLFTIKLIGNVSNMYASAYT